MKTDKPSGTMVLTGRTRGARAAVAMFAFVGLSHDVKARDLE